jgi:hypothetical protein
MSLPIARERSLVPAAAFDCNRGECVLRIAGERHDYCLPISALALTPTDSAAFAYQLSDLKLADRVAVRFLRLEFRSFCWSSFDVMRCTRTLLRTKLPTPTSTIGVLFY